MGGVSKQQLTRQLTRGCRQQISQGNQQGGKYGKGKICVNKPSKTWKILSIMLSVNVNSDKCFNFVPSLK